MRLSLRRPALFGVAIAAAIAAAVPVSSASASPAPSFATAAAPVTLTAADGAAGDYFGQSVAVSGNTMVVGSLRASDGSSEYVGAAYVYVRSAAGWALQSKLTASDAEIYSGFGISVAIDGDTIAVGAVSVGKAYVFVRTGSTWSEQFAAAGGQGSFGSSIAVQGDTLVVGAPRQRVAGEKFAGAAYVYHRVGAQWDREIRLTAARVVSGDGLGASVSVDGDTVLAGTLQQRCCKSVVGAAYVFGRGDAGWSQQARLRPADGEPGDSFGSSVDLDGDTAVVGSPNHDEPAGSNSGAAYVFTRSDGAWRPQAMLSDPQAGDFDSFGFSVAVDGDAAVVGAAYADAQASGAAYLFSRVSDDWTMDARATAPDSSDLAKYGYSVDIGSVVVVGAPFQNTAGGTEAGAAYVYPRP